MDLRQLASFVQVAEMGSFTRAAAVLQVAQPALSRQLRALEVELRQQLLHRNGRGVAPTEAGKRLLAHARGILQQVQRARDDLEDQRGASSGRFSIALPPSVSRTLTGPLVQAFRERLPRADLSVIEGLSAYALEWLAIARVDCAVVYNVAPSAAIDLQPLLNEPLYLVSARGAGGARSGRSVSLQAVAARELVIPSRPHSVRMLLEAALAAAGCRARVALEIESIPAILDLVRQGGCHAVLSANAVSSGAGAGDFLLQAIGPPPLVATLWMATSAQRPRGPLVDQGTALVAELMRELWRDRTQVARKGDAAAPRSEPIAAAPRGEPIAAAPLSEPAVAAPPRGRRRSALPR